MQQSILITGGKQTQRLEAAQEIIRKQVIHAEDTAFISGTASIGIEEIRRLKRTSSLSPISSAFRAIIIHPGELLTPESQNALLKILEEPPLHLILIITAPSSDHLLSTIASRCQVLKLAHGAEEEPSFAKWVTSLPKLSGMSVADRLQFTSEFAQGRDREFIVAEVDVCISAARHLLLDCFRTNGTWASSKFYVSFIGSLLLCRKALYANVNTQLALEHLFLTA